MKKIITLLFLPSLFACTNSSVEINSDKYTFPTIKVDYNGINLNYDSLRMINTDSLSEQYSGFVIGKYSTEVTNINLSYFNPDNLSEYDTVINSDDFQHDGLQIKLDTSQFIVDPWYFNIQDDKTAFYPLLLLNETNSLKSVTTIDNRVLMLQEIYYEPDYNWVAINSPLIFNMCGDSKSNILLKTNEYLLLNVPTYTGSDLVKIRVRVLSGDNIIISKPYYTKINLSQIYLPSDLKERLKKFSRKGSMGESYDEFLPIYKQ